MKIRKHATLALALLAPIGCGHGHDQHADAAAAVEAPPTPEIAWTELLPNARQALDGVVTGGQPTEEQLAQAAAAGYQTVVNLRMPSESGIENEADRVAEMGMTYVHLPIDGAEGITEENARALHESLEAAQRPVLLHCGSGNRVGALLALSSYYVDGETAEQALQYGLDSGLTGLEPVVREHLDSGNGE